MSDPTSAAHATLVAQINALPRPLRQYVHDLETDADPAGDKMRLLCLEENAVGLADEIGRLSTELTETRRLFPDAIAWLLEDGDRCASVVADAYSAWDGDRPWPDALMSEIAHRRATSVRAPVICTTHRTFDIHCLKCWQEHRG